jgi:hypothetical protein
MKQVPGFMRTAAAPLLAALVLASASWMTAAANGPARLDAGVLDQARGRNPGTVLGQSSCDAFDGLYPCSISGAPCNTCGLTGYTNVAPGSMPSGYKVNPATPSWCGDLYAGNCSPTKVCPRTSITGTCARPPEVLAQ